MKYRDFGKTGKKISQVGFGCMRLPGHEVDGNYSITDEGIEMMRKGYQLGINYFDTAVGYCNSQSEIAVGKAVKPFRDKVLVSTKCPLWGDVDKDVFKRLLNQSLTRLDMSYIDFYHIHGLNKDAFDNKVLALGLLDDARKALDQGMIKHLSFSFHDDPENMKYIIDRGEIFSSVLVQYNLLDRSNENAIAYAHGKGLGVVGMGPVAGGRLAAPSQLYEKLLGKKNNSTAELAMRFVLGNPNISCALSGMTGMQMVEENAMVGNLDVPMNEDDWKKAAIMMEDLKKFSDLYCTGCGYCLPCPQEINIPYVFNCYTYHNVYGMADLAKSMYQRIGDEDHGKSPEECVKCGACLEKCPQKIQIPDRFEEVIKAFK